MILQLLSRLPNQKNKIDTLTTGKHCDGRWLWLIKRANGGGLAGRWDTPLRLHILPVLGKMHVEEITQNEIKHAIAPIWFEKAETARKAMSRTGIVLRHAAAAGYDVDLQATEKAKALLGAQVYVVTHVPSISWQDVPAFYASLDAGRITHLALRLTILTACRSAEIRFINLNELNGDVWTIPATRTKTGNEHRVPLSKEALTIISQAQVFRRDGYLFPNRNKGMISDMTMSR